MLVIWQGYTGTQEGVLYWGCGNLKQRTMYLYIINYISAVAVIGILKVGGAAK